MGVFKYTVKIWVISIIIEKSNKVRTFSLPYALLYNDPKELPDKIKKARLNIYNLVKGISGTSVVLVSHFLTEKEVTQSFENMVNIIQNHKPENPKQWI